MTTATFEKFNTIIDTFKVGGESFVVLKKDVLDELIILTKSFLHGEKILKEKKTRSFSEFLKNVSKKK